MAQVINTNITSINAQRNLNESQSSLNTSLERLSTGLRINSAKDDAAGLAIAERFTAQIRGLDQATRNANDGISFAQTAEGALGTIGDALQRIRELSVQAVNDTNSASDRQAMNNEVSQLISEVSRVANATEFNGQKILDGSLDDLVFQVGANRNQTISVDGVDARGSQLGAEIGEGDAFVLSEITGVNDGTQIAAADFTDVAINGVAIDLTDAESLDDVVNSINAQFGDTGVQAARSSQVDTGTLAINGGTTASGTLTLNGVDIAIADDTSNTGVVDSINERSAQTGVSAEVDGSGFKLVSDSDIDAELTGITLAGLTAGDQESYRRGIDLSTDIGQTISLGGTDQAALGLDAVTLETFSANAMSVSTREDANDAIRTVDQALQQVNGLRAELGAVQTRFESTIDNLSTTSENLTASRSRIQDADFAAETANLTRAQILQQAGTSVLAQANAIPQNVLSLLG